MKSILLTRSAEDNAAWAGELRALGVNPVECACLESASLKGGSVLTSVLPDCDWLAFTSRRSVDALYDEIAELPNTIRLAAVGPATAERLREHFGRCDLESAEGTGADLGQALASDGAAAPIVITAQGGRSDVEEELAAANVRALRFELYTTRNIGGPLPPGARNADAAFFASPSAVYALAARGELEPSCALISIGPTTSAALRAVDLPVHAESRTRDLSGLLSALATLSRGQR